ncbi:MAG: recombinase family protein [Verrucomicrobiaceae bacterium]|nr:MAG: recombinase family protein [Verrucomicrobiaceae bacterium]
MRVGYARVSTKEQDTRLQQDALGQGGCDKVFVETASGAQKDRPELAKAIAYLRPGDVLVVWKLDRLARSVRQLVETVEDLSERGIGFVSLTEAIDTTSPGGRLVFHIFSSLAEFERELIRERTNAGLTSAKARGVQLGRPKAMTDAQMKVAKTLKAGGDQSAAQIAKHLGVSRATLYRSLAD